ncbi:sigma 54-interacting transcriptional regulator [Clostridium formicaceticum]|uniref:Arginine utilization regulatory protein RocR n=1 Tax=Clostridium formicaceticum TaxID=1497 RepID=A0AAC9WG58_9CLOT|nr:sigma 54-interacting transcriptional regulator [Clostridium formicaceticum]AOY77115.1 propanediol utilization protein [Clostridium formicaceticum]ARE87627.1 Arginine utilization regulatory protein RocR [Clostridium formicaceticum]
MGRICFIAPYEEIFQLAQQVKEESAFNFMLKKGNLEEGIQPAIEAEKQGAQVIISRGGTASFIKQNVHIPVVEIKVTGYDILKSLYPYRNTHSAIGIVGYRNVVNGCLTISEILNIPIKEVIIPNDEEGIDWTLVQQEVAELIRKYDIHVIVGDTTVISKLPSLEIDVNLITSGKEAVTQAIEEALHILQVREVEKEKGKRFKAVLDFVNDGVVATDENGIITVINPAAEDIFNVKREEVVGCPVKEIIPNTEIMKVLESKSADIQKLQKVSDDYIMTNRIPIVVDSLIKGVVATFQDVSTIQGAEQKIRQNLYTKGLITRYSFQDFLTKNQKMKRLIDIAKGFAKTHATVLIEGESGTGKEMFAQSIHALSPRKEGPFVAVNCAALPSQLLESELFGYVEGAFTGAKKGGKIGLFELAHNGTIFLDEIGEMDKSLQARLLRVLEEKQVMRLGSDKVIPVDIRIIAATNADLKDQIKQDAFRMDLYYRLNVLKLQTIPLRERKEDVEYLANYFVRTINKNYGRQVERFALEVMCFLANYHWPGNIRELKNIVERLILSSTKDYVTLDDAEFLIEELKEDFTEKATKDHINLLEGTLQEIKRSVILKVLEQENYNKSRTARRLGIDRSTVEKYLS